MFEVLVGIEAVSLIYSVIMLIRLKRTMPELFTNINSKTVSPSPPPFYTLSPSFEPRGRIEIVVPPTPPNPGTKMPIIQVMEFEE